VGEAHGFNEHVVGSPEGAESTSNINAIIIRT